MAGFYPTMPQMEPPQVLNSAPTPSRRDFLANELQRSRQQPAAPDFGSLDLRMLGAKVPIKNSGAMGMPGAALDDLSPDITSTAADIGYPAAMMNRGLASGSLGKPSILAGLLKGLGLG